MMLRTEVFKTDSSSSFGSSMMLMSQTPAMRSRSFRFGLVVMNPSGPRKFPNPRPRSLSLQSYVTYQA